NRLQDIQSLEELSSLEVLDLEQNMLADLSSLEPLTSLKELNIENNAEDLADLSFVTGLESLEKLEISIPEGVDAEPLGYLEKLQELIVHDSHLGSIEFLSPLEKLESRSEEHTSELQSR